MKKSTNGICMTNELMNQYIGEKSSTVNNDWNNRRILSYEQERELYA